MKKAYICLHLGDDASKIRDELRVFQTKKSAEKYRNSFETDDYEVFDLKIYK